MPEYLSPGVYVEEIDAGPRPIAGVSTSTTGMVGVTARGPVDGKPQLVTNFLEYQRTFGGFLPTPDPGLAARWLNNPVEGGNWWTFPLSVQGFFVNGGQRLYVKRVTAAGAVASSGALGSGCFAQITADAAAGETRLQVSHLFGFGGNTTTVTVVRGSDGVEIITTTIASYGSAGPNPTLTLTLPLTEEVRAARGDVIRVGSAIADPGTAANRALTITAASPGGWGDGVRVRVTPVASASLPLLADPGEGALFVTRLAADAASGSGTLTVEASPGLAAGSTTTWVLVDGVRLRVSSIDAVQNDSTRLTLTLAANTARDFTTGTAVRRVRRANPVNSRATVHLGGASQLYRGAQLQVDDGTNLTARTVAADVTGDVVTLDSPFNHDLFEGDRVRLVEAMVTAAFTDEAGGLVSETLGPARLTVAAEQPESLESVLATSSQLIRAVRGPKFSANPAQFPVEAHGGWLSLDAGDDNFGTLDTGDFAGEDRGSGHRTGIVALEDIDEISICAVPGIWSGTVQSALITHCETLKDRFAILDPQDGLSIEGIQNFREPYDTRYAALYYPWLVIPDTTGRGQPVNVAPSGHMAGIYARTDVERGVHKAPANTVVAGIRLTDGFAQDITKRHQDMLNPKGINALRFFPQFGHRVWGARTLSSDSAWKYINVRRLFLYLEESIDQGTRWAVFEPNSEALWALIKQSVSEFLTTTWRSGALAGTTPDEAFFVACDRTTMTDDDLQNGRLICVIGVAPVFPAEFVIFRIQQKTREAQLT